MNNVFIIGLGMLRFGKYPDRDVRDMAHEATRLALADAGLEKTDLQAAFFANTFWGMFANQHSIRGQVILRSMGIEAIPVTNVENACAGASTACTWPIPASGREWSMSPWPWDRKNHQPQQGPFPGRLCLLHGCREL
jgi:hypothetical protein